MCPVFVVINFKYCDWSPLDLGTFEIFITKTTITFVALISPTFEEDRHTNFCIILNNHNLHLNNIWGFNQRYVFIEIFKFPFLTLSDPIAHHGNQQLISLWIPPLVLYLLRYTKITVPDGDNVRVYSSPRCWLLFCCF